MYSWVLKSRSLLSKLLLISAFVYITTGAGYSTNLKFCRFLKWDQTFAATCVYFEPNPQAIRFNYYKRAKPNKIQHMADLRHQAATNCQNKGMILFIHG
jgi:hypothetical protein